MKKLVSLIIICCMCFGTVNIFVAGTQNLAFDKTVTANSTIGTTAVTVTVDGNNSSLSAGVNLAYWQPTNTAANEERWIQVDLGEVISVTSFKIYENRYYTRAYDIQYTNELAGTSTVWTTAYSGASAYAGAGGANIYKMEGDFSTVATARYFRFLFKNFSTPQASITDINVAYSIRIVEVELYYYGDKDLSITSDVGSVDVANKKISGLPKGMTVGELMGNIKRGYFQNILNVYENAQATTLLADNVKLTENMVLRITSYANASFYSNYKIDRLLGTSTEITSPIFDIDLNAKTVKIRPAEGYVDKIVNNITLPDGATMKLFEADQRTEIKTGKVASGSVIEVTPEYDETAAVIYTIIVDQASMSPEVRNATIIGEMATGITLNADYTYYDANEDKMASVSYEWYVGDKSDMDLVVGEQQASYLIKEGDLGKYIYVKIIVNAENAPTYGEGISAVYGPIEKPLPKISNIKLVKSLAGVDVSFDYYDPFGLAQGEHLYKWQKSNNPYAGFVEIPAATYDYYNINPADKWSYLRVLITPVSIDARVGEQVHSTQVLRMEDENEIDTLKYKQDLGKINEWLGSIDWEYNTVSKSFYLPYPSDSAITTSWYSDNIEVISVTPYMANVDRPSADENDKEVTLYITAFCGNAAVSAGYKVKVLRGLNDAEAVDADLSAISLPSSANDYFGLPIAGDNGTTITWKSNKSAIIVQKDVAIVNTDSVEQIVELTATVNKNYAEAKKSFNVTVAKTNTNTENIALRKKASADSNANGYAPANATDGLTATEWRSITTANQWLQVDLGVAEKINSSILKETRNYLGEWKIQVTNTANSSGIGTDWVTVATGKKSVGGTANVTTKNRFPTVKARYIRLLSVDNTSPWLQEFEVFYDKNKDTTVSSTKYSANYGDVFTISEVKEKTSVSEFLANIYLANGADRILYNIDGSLAKGSITDGMKLLVISPDGTTSASYIIKTQNNKSEISSKYCVVNQLAKTITINEADTTFVALKNVLIIPEGARLNLYMGETEITYGSFQSGAKLVVTPMDGLSKSFYDILVDYSPKAPEARNIQIIGEALKWRQLESNFAYYDGNNDVMTTVEYQWLRGNTLGGEFSAISEAKSSKYTLTAEDVGKYIVLDITVKNNVSPTSGTSRSVVIGPIDPAFPVATNAKIAGNLTIGSQLTGTYTYADPNNFADVGSSFRWLASDTAEGIFAPISGATNKSYVITQAEYGKYLKFEVTPKNNNGDSGLPVCSQSTMLIGYTNLARTYQTITSSTAAGNTLAVDGDKSTFWLVPANDYTAYVQILWNTTQTFNRVVLKGYGEIAGYQLQYTTDGVTWVQLNTLREPFQVGELEYSIPKTQATGVRLTLLRKQVNTEVGVYEFGLYNNGEEYDLEYDGLQKIANTITLPNTISGIIDLPIIENVSWTSQNSSTISVNDNSAKAVGEAGSTGVISAIVKGNHASIQKNFTVTVQGGATDEDMARDDLEEISLPRTVTADFRLPVGKRGSQITWTSNNTAISVSGSLATVKRSASSDVVVTLTATAKKGEATQTQMFTVVVKSTGTTTDGPRGGSPGTTTNNNVNGGNYFTGRKEQATEYFADLQTVVWAKDYIIALAERGIINGKSDKIFAPTDNLKREELAKILTVGFELDMSEGEIACTDVLKNAWYYPYVCAMFKGKITNGMGDNIFGVGRDISRQDAMCQIARIIKKSEMSVGEDVELFSDDGEIAAYAKEDMYLLRQLGVISGDENNNLSPNKSITRAEISKVIYLTLTLHNP